MRSIFLTDESDIHQHSKHLVVALEGDESKIKLNSYTENTYSEVNILNCAVFLPVTCENTATHVLVQYPAILLLTHETIR